MPGIDDGTNPRKGRLTPDNAACLLIDHQTGLFSFSPSIEPAAFKDGILGLAKTAKAFGLPAILTTSWPQGPNGPTLPELVELFPDNEIIDRPFVNFWDDGPSVAAVKRTGRKKLIMAGITLDVCAAMPAISAVRDGYEVHVVIDACGTWSKLAEMTNIVRLAAAGVVVTNWVAVLAELAHNTRENGKHVAEILGAHIPSYGAGLAQFMGTARNAGQVAAMLGGDAPKPLAAE